MTAILPQINKALADIVDKIMKTNRAEAPYRGGQKTKRNWLNKKYG